MQFPLELIDLVLHTYIVHDFIKYSFYRTLRFAGWERTSERCERNISSANELTLFVLLAAWVTAGGCNVRSKSNCSEEVSAANHYFQKRYLFPQVLVCRRCAGCCRNCDKWRSQEQLVPLNFSGQSCCRRPLKTTQTSRVLAGWRESVAVWFQSPPAPPPPYLLTDY